MKSKTIGRIKAAALSIAMCLQLVVPTVEAEAAQTFYDNKTGYEDGFDYELWKDYGSTSMTIKGGGNFECWWENIGNVLFRKGKKFDCTQTYQQIGNMSINFGVDYQPNGNSYLCVYGWTRNPLVEYYIVESWGSWRPPGANSKGQITVDGGTYDVYETTRVNQPSIDGNTTFQQYWSVRTSKRNSGTISVSQHFQAWERMGMKMGNIYEVAFNVEGYQSSGWADVYKNELTIGGSISSGGNNGGGSNSGSGDNSNSAAPGTAQGTRVECENMTISGQYAGTISSPFNGVALYANDESVSYTQNFTSGTHDFTLSGASNGDNLASVDLYIGGENKGTFYYGDANHAEYTIKNVSHGTGNQKIELKVSGDDGTWDAYADALIISGSGVGSGNTGNNNNNNNNNSGNVSSGATMECENMTKSGQYTGNVSSPFNGVALYANDDAVSYTQNFTSGTSNFTLTGASNGDSMARVDLFIGGQNKGTFYFGDANVANYTIENVSHGTGNQKVELKVTADDGSWDAFIDKLTISGQSTGGNTGNQGGNTGSQGGNTGNNNNNGGAVSNNSSMECENMTKSGQYTGNVSSPFNGVALYANDDAVSYTQNFASGTHDFTLRGASNGDSMARVDLFIGGQNKGTFYFGDANVAEYTIENVSHGTGNQKVELKVTADDGSWDAFIDTLIISAAGTAGAGSNSGNSGSNNNNNNTKPSGKMVALTFDDGPSSTTPYVLDVLEQYNAKATFFLIGQQVNSDTMSIMQRQVEMGCELANHSYTHQDMGNMSAQDVKNQIEWTSSAIKNTVGVDVKFFRAPYLSTSNTMFQNVGLAFIQGIDTKDYDSNTSVNQRVSNVLNNVSDGSIVLLHDFQGNNNTVQALPQIIEGLQSQGYTLVTLSELFEYKGVNPNQGYKVWSNVYN
ncbi:MAG: glycoside hydrolase family 11 protein [Lachnospiraceae bacterium]|nr:glycoside hydrolase family 11 protein [Lachnospiraceae bacterium]